MRLIKNIAILFIVLWSSCAWANSCNKMQGKTNQVNQELTVKSDVTWPQQFQEHYKLQFQFEKGNQLKIKHGLNKTYILGKKTSFLSLHQSSITLTLHFKIQTYLQHKVIRI
jgi:hypothetical protein